MSKAPAAITTFLQAERLAVIGVSRRTHMPANAIFRKLRKAGYQVFPINPHAGDVAGVRCYPDVASLPEHVDGVVLATHPRVSASVVQQCASAGIGQVWMHRSFGEGSVSPDAVAACEQHGITCIVGGCPLMFCEPVDIAHKCMRWWLQRRGRVAR